MGDEPKRVVGRRPGSVGTRDMILNAARARFADQGYSGASLRAIARDAGVDASMVSHFFGSKAGLFGAVIEWPLDPSASLAVLLDGDTGDIGHRLATAFVQQWRITGWRDPIVALAAAGAADPAAAVLLRDFLCDRLLVPVLEGLGIDRPRLRAGMISSVLIGVGLGRYALGLANPVDLPDDDLIEALAPALQTLCTDERTA